MQRPIKFRAWDKRNKTMQYTVEIHCNSDGSVGIHGEHSGRESDDFIPLQYTGLKDKNGVEIYEGDVVFIDGRRAVVIYTEGEFKFMPEGNPDEEGNIHYYTIQWTPIDVIGNIYENPELLK